MVILPPAKKSGDEREAALEIEGEVTWRKILSSR